MGGTVADRLARSLLAAAGVMALLLVRRRAILRRLDAWIYRDIADPAAGAGRGGRGPREGRAEDVDRPHGDLAFRWQSPSPPRGLVGGRDDLRGSPRGLVVGRISGVPFNLRRRWQPSRISGGSASASLRFEACTAFNVVAARVVAEPPKAVLWRRSASANVVASIVRSDCYRLERQLPGGIRTRWGMAPCHGAPRSILR